MTRLQSPMATRTVADGHLPVVRVGGIVRVPAAVLDQLAANALAALAGSEPAEAS